MYFLCKIICNTKWSRIKNIQHFISNKNVHPSKSLLHKNIFSSIYKKHFHKICMFKSFRKMVDFIKIDQKCFYI